MRKATPAFTLLEMMVTLAILGIIAAAAIPIIRSAQRNAGVSSAAFDLQLRLQGLKTRALADQDTLLAVLVDAPSNDGRNCVLGRSNECATLIILRNPTAAWTLAAFDPANPGTNASFVDSQTLGKGIRFANDPTKDLAKVLRPAPAPFQSVLTFASKFAGVCSGRACVAIRYSPNGTVSGEIAAPAPGTSRGLAFAIGSDLVNTTRSSECRAVLVTFPSGIVKSFAL